MFVTSTKYILPLIAAFLVSFQPVASSYRNMATPKPVRWAIEKTSTLQVAGKSNVNEFTCAINGYFQQDTILCDAGAVAGKPVRLSGSMEIDVFKFDCHSRIITGDLRKILKADDHPLMKIRFLSLERFPAFQQNSQCTKGWVEVELAGVRKTFQIAYEFTKQGPASLQLNGAKTFCFSDFQLSPPRKLGGIIKIEDEFKVDFCLILKPC